MSILEKKDKNLVLDLRSERLYREAEDELFYFNNTYNAIEKLKQALDYTPGLIKAINLLAGIFIICGDFQQACNLYKEAEMFEPSNVKILANLANIYEFMGNDKIAKEYVDKALAFRVEIPAALKKSLLELKYTVLLNLKKYDEAEKILIDAKYALTASELRTLQAESLFITRQHEQIKKKLSKTELRLIK